MTVGFGARRRADEFDALVEAERSGRSESAASLRDAELLEFVSALRTLPEVHARPEFVADLRAQLLAEAATALAPADVERLRLPQRHNRRERRLAALVGGIAIVGATTSVAVASQSALPGDSLYPIKRVIESAHTGISLSDGSRGSTMLDNASSRLDEAAALSDRGDDDQIASTLSSFTDQATAAADLLLDDYERNGTESSITRLRSFVTASLSQLEVLEPTLPPDARDALVTAAHALADIDAEAAQRCPACAGSAPEVTLPPTLAGAQITLPTAPPPLVEKTDVTHGQKTGGHRPELPDVDDVGPGSISSAGTSTDDESPVIDPLQQLTDSLTGTGKGKGKPSSSPSVPVVSDAVTGVTKILHDVLDPITGGLSSD